MTTVGIATGAGRGMGLACAERMVDLVDRLLLVDVDAESVHQALVAACLVGVWHRSRADRAGRDRPGRVDGLGQPGG